MRILLATLAVFVMAFTISICDVQTDCVLFDVPDAIADDDGGEDTNAGGNGSNGSNGGNCGCDGDDDGGYDEGSGEPDDGGDTGDAENF